MDGEFHCISNMGLFEYREQRDYEPFSQHYGAKRDISRAWSQVKLAIAGKHTVGETGSEATRNVGIVTIISQ